MPRKKITTEVGPYHTYKHTTQRTRRREMRYRLVYGPPWHKTIEPFTTKQLTTKRIRALVKEGTSGRVEKLSPAGIWLRHESFGEG